MLDELKQHVRDLLAGDVSLVVAYGESADGRTSPVFPRKPEDADGLVWNERCYYNLTRYLTDRDVLGDGEGKIGIVVKGCDLKTLNVLLAEKQVKRENLAVIAVRCEGMKDADGNLLAKCETCTVADPAPSFCDRVIGPVPRREPREDDFKDVGEIEAMSPAERLAHWSAEFDRCLRCDACRSICPLCYCRECLASQHDPRWIPASSSITGNRLFHIVRALHLAGRCTNCGECERVCPVGIPITMLMRKMGRVVRDDFGFEPGATPDQRPPLVSFAPNDPDPEEVKAP